MPIKYNVPSKGRITIKYKDVFHLEDLYKSMHWWLNDRAWSPKDSHEDFYLEKWSGTAVEHIMRWNVSKEPTEGSKIFLYTLFVEFHTLGVVKHDMIVEGKKLAGVVKGEVEIAIQPTLLFDPKDTIKKNPFLSPFYGSIYNRMYKKRIEKLKLDLYNEVYEFQGSIKKFLQLKQFIPMHDQEPFHPIRSFPT